ncbi:MULTISPECIES: hypothetical protein [unclassified Lentimonas]|uniref:hypothetical protein n=1 Tax=unclassified Lentimonas TaxID=2630993 RepID=UPI0013261A97|nr:MULTISPECIES: hypothetical protein [unclassified Lentimonas]CAA6697034.1 Unannotated [Lentimonas sp. CC10]CAA7070579.1 Unannotated [Lentimonas sp. CC11]
MCVTWGGTASALAAFYAAVRRASARNQSTSTPQDEAELVPPEWIKLEITILDARQHILTLL